MHNNSAIEDICFGWNRATDEQSLRIFLQKFSSNELLTTLIPRLTDKELNTLVDQLTEAMKAHLSEQEYHRLFLGSQKT